MVPEMPNDCREGEEGMQQLQEWARDRNEEEARWSVCVLGRAREQGPLAIDAASQLTTGHRALSSLRVEDC